MTVHQQPATMFSGGVAEPPETVPAAEAAPEVRVPARPVATEAGRYLRATARDEPLSPHRPTGDTATRVWEIAFGLAARRRFAPGAPLAEIGRSVLTALRERCPTVVPPLDAEMLVRDALGETVPVDEIDPARRIIVHLLIFAAFTDELALGDAELDNLIAEAEELTAAGR
jgi:hypothetical protein